MITKLLLVKHGVLTLTLFFILLGSFQRAHAQKVTVRYKENKEDFPNPERGFYIPAGTSARHFVPLEADSLKKLFAGPQKYGKARYAIYSTLLMREYTLDSFQDRPLGQQLLNAIGLLKLLVRGVNLKTLRPEQPLSQILLSRCESCPQTCFRSVR